MSEVKNLFVEREEAKRYNTFRPIYHHLPAQILHQYFGKKIPKTLDVACGTGHSTLALAKISDSIIGCDLSMTMLAEAKETSSLQFIHSPAEDLPFPDSQFDYLNLSMAFQWLNQSQFLLEASRVLKSDGFLGIDNYGFTGQMKDHDSFSQSYKSFDQQHMKSAPRHKNFPDLSDLTESGLRFVTEFNYEHEVRMNKYQFINYLMTRSNFLDLPSFKRAEVAMLLNDYYEEHFQGANKLLRFRGLLKLYQPTIF